MIKISQYTLETATGKLLTKLPFLSKSESEKFDEIGYTGKLNGKKTSRIEYLNSLSKGRFSIKQVKYDNGDFIEEFILARAYNGT